MKNYKFSTYRTFTDQVLGRVDRDAQKEVKTEQKASKLLQVVETDEEVSQSKKRLDHTIELHNLNNHVLIVDEVHNMLGSDDYYKSLERIIQNSTNLRVVFLSATPMYNKVSDIAKIMHLLNPAAAKELPSDETRFTHKFFQLPEKPNAKPDDLALTIENRGIPYVTLRTDRQPILLQAFKGVVSFIRAYNPDLFPRMVNVGKRGSSVLLVPVSLSEIQYKTYMAQHPEDIHLMKNHHNLFYASNFVFPNGMAPIDLYVAKGKRKGSNFANYFHKTVAPKEFKSKHNQKTVSMKRDVDVYMPINKEFRVSNDMVVDNQVYWTDEYGNVYNSNPLENVYSKIIARRNVAKDPNAFEKIYRIPLMSLMKTRHPETHDWMHGFLHRDHLGNYSSKFRYILDMIERSMPKRMSEQVDKVKANGPIFVYCKYVKNSGALLFSKMLEANGFQDYVLHPTKSSRPKYLLMTGDKHLSADLTRAENETNYLNEFNRKENLYGEIIKVFIGTQKMGEGITLKNVRQIHIVDPWWNLARLDQIVGRGIRLNSDMHLYEKFRIEEKYDDYLKEIALAEQQKRRLQIGVNMKELLDQNFIKREEYNEITTLLESTPTKEIWHLLSSKLKQMKKATSAVSVYRYVSTDPKGELPTIDEIYYQIADKKDHRIKLIERLLKQSAVDCALNKNRNLVTADEKIKDGARRCDYSYCYYDCIGADDEYAKMIAKITEKLSTGAKLDFNEFDLDELTSTPNRRILHSKSSNDPGVTVDRSTYSLRFDQYQIKSVREMIAGMYERNYIYTLSDIKNVVATKYPHLDNHIMYEALNQLLQNNTESPSIYDMYNNRGYLSYYRGYYVFTPYDTSNKTGSDNYRIPIAYRTQPSLEVTYSTTPNATSNYVTDHLSEIGTADTISAAAIGNPGSTIGSQTLALKLSQVPTNANATIEIKRILRNYEKANAVSAAAAELVSLAKNLVGLENGLTSENEVYEKISAENRELILRSLVKMERIFPNRAVGKQPADMWIGYVDAGTGSRIYWILDLDKMGWVQTNAQMVIKYFNNLKSPLPDIPDTVEGVVNIFNQFPDLSAIGLIEKSSNKGSKTFKVIQREVVSEVIQKMKTGVNVGKGKAVQVTSLANNQQVRRFNGRNCYTNSKDVLLNVVQNLNISPELFPYQITHENLKLYLDSLPATHPIIKLVNRQVKEFLCYLIIEDLKLKETVYGTKLIIRRQV